MGSKSRIFLGHILSLIEHYIRNHFEKEIFISKRSVDKIKNKHPECFCFTSKKGFAKLMSGTLGCCIYLEKEDTHNFIAMVSDRYYLYALKKTQHHTICSTIYVLNKRTLKKEITEDFIYFDMKSKEEVESYIQIDSE